jgi:hypothetical protein
MDAKQQQENIDKGNEGEKLFAEYLDSQNIPFYRVDQKRETYSGELSAKRIHRPDFIIHTKRGLFHIDVKCRKKQIFVENEEKRFYLNQDETKRLFNLQNELNSHVWLAFIDDINSKEPIFYYASMSEIHEYYITACKMYEEIYLEAISKFPKLWVFVPERLLYDRLSLENGFYKEPDLKFFEKEAKYWKKKVDGIIKSDNST